MPDQHKSNEDRIRERAYALWEQEGRPDGREQDHWTQASGEMAPEQAAAGTDGGTRTAGRPSVDQLNPAEAAGATIPDRSGGTARRSGSEPEAKSRKPL